MSKINLNATLAMKNSVGNINAIKGIGFSWAKPISGIANYYGIGAGQIPIHHKPSDPANITLDGNSKVLTSTNLGGAGTLFDLAQFDSARAPGLVESAFDFSNVSGRFLLFSNPPDLIGIHLVAAIKTDYVRSMGVVASGESSNSRLYWTHATSERLRWRFSNGSVQPAAHVTTDTTAWHIAEFRNSGGEGHLFFDGVKVLTESDPGTSFMIYRIGTAESNIGTPNKIGDFASVICDTAYSATNLEPAVLLARSTLAAKYGVTLA